MPVFSYLSTFPPTRCGLASFTEALAGALTADAGTEARVVRMMDELAHPAATRTGVRIVGELDSAGSAAGPALRNAARALGRSDVAIVQHEYGIFGGTDGADVIGVLEQLDVPSIVVLHTVLDAPTDGQRAVLERVTALAGAVVVMTATALLRLERHYAVDARKVVLIPHGVATWAPVRPHRESDPDGDRRKDRRTVLTWGLIGPGKGIEHGIRAIALLAAGVGVETPAVHYVVAGQTHPKVLARDGEAYRESLRALAERLGVAERVHLDGGYLDAAGLADQVEAADLVLLPYDSRNQVTSGVLVEAVGAGKPVVATAFPHAVEVLTERTGVVVAHEDPAAMAAGMKAVLDRLDAPDRPAPEPRPSDLGPTGRSWADVARRYRELAARLTTEHPATPAPALDLDTIASDTPDGGASPGPGSDRVRLSL